MLRQVRATMDEHGLVTSGERVVVAVSGGADSVALLHALRELAPRYRLRLTVAHLNHRLRGRAADEDAAFVAALAKRLKLPCVAGGADVAALARRRGVSLEMAARAARYAFLARVARQAGAHAIATAHTADDQAETVLLKLARGAGPQGLSGIPYDAAMKAVRLVRPLLDVSRAQVLAYLRQRGLVWREDATNQDVTFLRNRVRHEVLPLLERTLNPRVREALVRTARILRDENDWLEAQAAEILSDCIDAVVDDDRAGGAVKEYSLRVDRLSEYPVAARRRVVRRWLVQSGVPAEAVDFETIDRVERLLASRQGSGTAPLPDGEKVLRRYRRLVLETAARAAVVPAAVTLKVPGRTLWKAAWLRIETRLAPGVTRPVIERPGWWPVAASLSAEVWAGRPLVLRAWRPGDRLRPFGLRGSKKIHDILVDLKVPRDLRDGIPLLECAGEIVWLPGYRIAADWAVPDRRRDAVQIAVDRIGAPAAQEKDV